MRFDPALLEGRLIRRYKRFLADVELAGGERVVAHCPNTGSMLGCAETGSRVWLSRSDNPRRKLAYSWQLVETAEGSLACINTALPNRLVGEWLGTDRSGDLALYRERRSEVRYGREGSRIDWLLQHHRDGQPDAYLEVKNLTLGLEGIGYFPDAVTERGRKHLRELTAMAAAGQRAILLFCVSHSGVGEVRPADWIDPAYGQALREAEAGGVELLAVTGPISPVEIELERLVPVYLPGR